MSNMTINAEQRLFVLKSGGGFTCLGFDVVFKRLKQYAQLLRRPQPNVAEIGTPAQYQQYLEAENAYIATRPTNTFFDPDTPAAVQTLLEAYRKSGKPLRVFLGNAETGRDWLEEFDVVGSIGRSMGPLKVPLLVAKGADGGGALLTANIVRLVDATSLREVYRHPAYHLPEFDILPCTDTKGYAEMVQVQGQVHARFRKEGQAAKWVEFMQGKRKTAR